MPMLQLNEVLQSINREEKEIEQHMEGYIAFMRTCKFVTPQPAQFRSPIPIALPRY